ncbi:MAG: YSC84-related protein [Acidiferrobacterales bacterium]
MRALSTFTLTIFALVAVSWPVEAGWDPRKEQKQYRKVQAAIKAFRQKDPSLKIFFKQAYGYVVFPKIVKGAIGIGGAHGKGLVFRRGRVIGRASLSQGTIGFQLGGQAYSEIIFFQNRTALKRLTDGNLEFAAQATAVAANKGVAANADYHKGVAVFTLAKGGLMYEASIGGQKFSYKPKK